MKTILAIVRGSLGFYDPTYLPRFVRRLEPPPGHCLLVVKGWFAHGRFSMQRDPWVTVEVWCDSKLITVLTEGLGRTSRLVAPLELGFHDIKFIGDGLKEDETVVLYECRVNAQEGQVQYIAFVPPRPNPFARKPQPSGRWFSSSWVPGE